ncbi:MAG: hypothetical protein NZ524_02635 [Thiobacillaceae bacterium]|nr:hypothetical protein [Thiobacillaceae bacterium]MDW8324546.1 hypothetical protein [Burkholderiales bacterium]
MSGIERILLAASGAETPQWVETAAELARALEAELTALFVEDVDLLRASRLPSSWEIGRLTAQSRPLQPERTQRSLQAAARRLEQALREAARARSLRFSFSVLQGRPWELLLAYAAAPNRLIYLPSRRLTLASPRPLVVAFDDSMAGVAGLTVGLRLAHSARRTCVVLVAAQDAQALHERMRQVEWAMHGRQTVLFERLAALDAERLAAAARRLMPAALILPAAAEMQRLAQRCLGLGCDVLLAT